MDLLLLMAAKENDAPKVAELIRAGAELNTKVGLTVYSDCFKKKSCQSNVIVIHFENVAVQGTDGKTAKELATSDVVLDLLNEPASAYTF